MTEEAYWQGVADGRWKSYHADTEFQAHIQSVPIPEWVKVYKKNPAPLELFLMSEHQKFRHLTAPVTPFRHGADNEFEEAERDLVVPETYEQTS